MSDHYFTPRPTSGTDRRVLTEAILDLRLTFVTDAGVFSGERIDPGTRLLLERLPPLSGEALDLGCGWGAAGVTLAKAMPELKLTMTDVNTRALKLARENLKMNGVQAETLESDGFAALQGRWFDAILTNPPIRAGKETVYRLLGESRLHLKAGGALYAVIRKQQGADSAFRFLESVFTEVGVLKKSGGYTVFQAR
jgi:16S rRNA (guanine1207-N2)-methyltransferase